MAKKFSELPVATVLLGTEILAVVQTAISKQTTVRDVATYVQPVVKTVAISTVLSLADGNTYLRVDSPSDVVITVPPQASVVWGNNVQLRIEQSGLGGVTITGGAGVTINKKLTVNPKLDGQFSVVTLIRTSVDTWTLYGSLEVI